MEKHVYELVRGLVDRGIDVTVICEDRSHLPDPVDVLEDRIVGVAPESLSSEGWIATYREKSERFAGLLDPGAFDVVHCHSHYGRDVALKVARNPDGPALVTTFHLTPIGQLERFRQVGVPEPEGAPIDLAVSNMEATSARLSDRCIAVSHGVRREIVRYYSVPPERVSVIHNWFDPNSFDTHDRSSARSALHLDPDAPYLLYIGHFDLPRGRLLAEAIRLLPPEISLLVVHPEADDEIGAEFGERVRFFGYQTPQQLARLYAAADLQVFPAVYSGFGLVLVEGMACGCPPVVFDFSAMNEVVTPESGFFAAEPTPEAYARAIVRALPEAAAKRPGAIRRSREFVMDRQIDRVVDLYSEILAERAARHAPTLAEEKHPQVAAKPAEKAEAR